MKPFLKPLLFQCQIVFHVRKLLLERNGRLAFERIHVAPQEQGKIPDGRFRFLRVHVAKLADRREGIVEKMRLDLGKHHVDALLCQLLLLPLEQ